MRSGRHDPTAEAPEVVSYLAMSLTASPALDRAMAFAAEHAKGPLAQSLRSALWDVHLRARTRIEEAFLSVADAWGTRNADVKRALYGIAEAVRDGSRTTVTHAVDRARIQVFEGSRRRMREYAASLKAPTTALFALGVLLPLIVSSIVPLLSLGSFSPSAIEVVAEDTGNPLPWIVLLDVGFPLGAFTFAHLVSRRPLTSRGEMRARNTLLGFVSIPDRKSVV